MEARRGGSARGRLRGWPGFARTPSPVTAESAGRAGSEPLRRGRQGRFSLRDSRDWAAQLTREGRPGQRSRPGRAGAWPLLFSVAVRAGTAESERRGAQENWRAAWESRSLCNNFRGNAQFQACGETSPSSHVCVCKNKLTLPHFLFLVLTVADAFRTSRRGHAHFNEPGIPARPSREKCLERGLGPEGLSGKRLAAQAEAPLRHCPSRAVGRGRGQGATRAQKSCVRAARGRCGPRLRPRPCSGGPGAVPDHRSAVGALAPPDLSLPTSV